MRTKYEFKGVILNKFGFDKKEKNQLWRRAKSSLKLNPIKIGEEDVQIIARFLKWKIDKVYTSDTAFYETCKFLGLKVRLIRISEYSQLKKR